MRFHGNFYPAAHFAGYMAYLTINEYAQARETTAIGVDSRGNIISHPANVLYPLYSTYG